MWLPSSAWTTNATKLLPPKQRTRLVERSLLAEGCRDALVLWGDVLVDGHNRYGICQQHGLPFARERIESQ